MPPKGPQAMSAKRIAKELNDLKKDALPQGCTAGPASDENVYEWSASIGAFARLEGWRRNEEHAGTSS